MQFGVSDHFTAERIEAKSISRRLKLMRFCASTLVVLAFILFTLNGFKFNNISDFIEIAIFLTFGVYYLRITTRKKTEDRFGQFIEWHENSFSYKLKGSILTNTVCYEKIESVSTEKEKIKLKTTDNLELILDISDYLQYSQKRQIKMRFEMVKKTIKPHSVS